MTQPVPLVRCVALARTYHPAPDVEVDALLPATFDIWPGDKISIVGPSGSGKSTLLNLLGLLDAPTSGTYAFDGRPTHDLDEAARAGIRAASVGFVFQAFHLLGSRTAAENVELGLLHRAVPRRDRRLAARQALSRVGLEHLVDANVTTLSGGERQRVAVARAIVREPQLLLADEPTGSLDSETGSQILTLLDELNQAGLTQIVVTHDDRVAATAERQFVVRDGHVSEQPTGPR